MSQTTASSSFSIENILKDKQEETTQSIQLKEDEKQAPTPAQSAKPNLKPYSFLYNHPRPYDGSRKTAG